MRIAIVNNQAPFVRGGAELLATWLHDKLEEYGHQAEIVRLPFAWSSPERILDSMLASRLVRLANVERVVALKFPAYYVPHGDKILWLLHQFRQVYDLWGTPYQGLSNNQSGHAIREAVVACDDRYLPEAREIFTNSHIVGHRLGLYNGLASEVLFPPVWNSTIFRSEGYGDYFFFPSRITAGKRQHLAVAAMARMGDAARLVIAGQPESPADLDRLTGLIREHDLRNVEVIPRWISEDEKVRLLAGCRGVVYLPYDEDSYGYVTLEAFHARKPVVTMSDSGGTLELVRHDRNGIVASDIDGLVAALGELAEDERLARRLGECGHQTIDELDISWERVVRCLAG